VDAKLEQTCCFLSFSLCFSWGTRCGLVLGLVGGWAFHAHHRSSAHELESFLVLFWSVLSKCFLESVDFLRQAVSCPDLQSPVADKLPPLLKDKKTESLSYAVRLVPDHSVQALVMLHCCIGQMLSRTGCGSIFMACILE
jgi:hypothetical protein